MNVSPSTSEIISYSNYLCEVIISRLGDVATQLSHSLAESDLTAGENLLSLLEVNWSLLYMYSTHVQIIMCNPILFYQPIGKSATISVIAYSL